jgi:putative phosphoribosyl transferase
MVEPIFDDRLHAGEELAKKFKLPSNAVIFAIPRGGVPVGYALATKQNKPMDIVVVRKLYIPWEPEAGFGAITLDGEIVLNPRYASLIPPEVASQVAKEVLREVIRRNEVYREGKGYKSLEGKVAVVVDDGFASGYTAIAAAKYLKKFKPEGLIALAPVCPKDTQELMKDYFNEVQCLVVSEEYPFAVASLYKDFHDLEDAEVLEFVNKLKEKKLWWPELD